MRCRIETGRCENRKENESTCLSFFDCVEDAIYVLLCCYLYADVRQSLFDKAVFITSSFPFRTLNDDDKLSLLFPMFQ